MRRFVSRALVALALILFPAAAHAAPISEKTVLTIPHYPDEECGDVFRAGRYLEQVCTTTARRDTIVEWADTAYSANDGWHYEHSLWARRFDGTRVGMHLKDYPKITYFARDESQS